MSLPVVIVGQPGKPGHHPPFKSSGDAHYVVVTSVIGTVLGVSKATDPTDAFVLQDVLGQPAAPSTLRGHASVQEDDIIHIVAWTDNDYEYYTFNMATDVWAIDELIITPASAPTNPWASIKVRSGVPVVVYAGDPDQIMGGKKERVDAAHRDGGSWTVGIALDAGGDIHYGNPNVVKGPLTDDMHVLWQQTTNTADPPTAWEGFEARTLDPSNNLSTTVTDALDTDSALLGMSNGISYDDAGTQRMLFAGISLISGKPRIYVPATEDGADDISIGTTVSDTAGDDAFVNGEAGICSVGELDGELHQLYSGGITSTQQDLFYTTSADDGATWSTPIEEIDDITVNFISANIYVRDIDTVMAYVYDDAGVQKYNEKVLIAGQTHQIMM